MKQMWNKFYMLLIYSFFFKKNLKSNVMEGEQLKMYFSYFTVENIINQFKKII